MKKAFALFLTLALLAVSISLPAAGTTAILGLTATPLVHLAFDGNLLDSSGNGYDGISLTPVAYEDGTVEQAARLDGDMITLTGTNVLKWDNGFALSLWLKPDANVGNACLVNMGSADPDWHYYVNVSLNNDGESFDSTFLQTAAWNDEGAEIGYGFLADWPESGSRHLVVSYDGMHFDGYLDGELVTSFDADPTFNTEAFFGTGLDITIGGADGMRAYSGLLDDLMIFGEPLTATEAAALYRSGNEFGQTDEPGATPAASPDPNAVLMAVPTTALVTVDGKTVDFEAYNINGSNYFKLRDIAMAINGTPSQFSVTWNDAQRAIELMTGMPYQPVGGELGAGDGLAKTPTPNTSAIYRDGSAVALTAYNITGYNFFKLRDIGQTLDFGVTWKQDVRTIAIDTSAHYRIP